MHPDGRWKPALRDKILFVFEQGKITKEEAGQGIIHPGIAAHLKNFDPGSLQDGTGRSNLPWTVSLISPDPDVPVTKRKSPAPAGHAMTGQDYAQEGRSGPLGRHNGHVGQHQSLSRR